ncbi:MAG: hypothetical protein JXK07_14850 [Spirochaetes bacterium]|nr:hypothetical protein [Spirochaetota bacterium]MBN2769934.1 hypothetical protein [Spirochaetota bacterium]
MKTNNIIRLNSWDLNPDCFGSTLKKLESDFLAVELHKAVTPAGKEAYNSVKLTLNHYFENRFYRIPKCRWIRLQYRTENLERLDFFLEENQTVYDYYKVLPLSENVWHNIKIPLDTFDIWRDSNRNTALEKDSISGLVFNLFPDENKSSIGRFFIRELVFDRYELIILNRRKLRGYTNYLCHKGFFSELRAFYKAWRQTKKTVDSTGKPLYCVFPFTQLRINRTYITVCCEIITDENVDFINDKTLADIWRGEIFSEIRQGIKDLSYRKCDLNRCHQFSGPRESFKTMDYLTKHLPDIADFIQGKTKNYKGLPSYIVNSFDSACNLACPSCTAHEFDPLPSDVGNLYIQQIENIGGCVEEMLIAGFGDPFVSPVYRKWLFSFSDEPFTNLKKIKIMSNGLLWTKTNWEKVSPDIKKHEIFALISIDAASSGTYEINRKNGCFTKLLENLEFLSDLRKRKEIASLVLFFVVQKNNYREMHDFIDLAKRYSADTVSFNRITNWGSYSPDEFDDLNIFDKNHPEYDHFIKVHDKIDQEEAGSLRIYFGYQL